MTNQEYINEHPEKFKDDIDKWLFTEFSIIGGCCSAQGSVEYSIARMVAERLLDRPTSDYAWKIYNFIWDYKYGKFGENLTLQQAIDKYFKK